METELEQVCRLLKNQFGESQSRVSLGDQTGPCETLLVGTAEGYLRLAHALVEFVLKAQTGQTDSHKIGDWVIPSTDLGNVCEGFNFCWDQGFLASDEAERKRIVDYFYDHIPPSPATNPPAN